MNNNDDKITFETFLKSIQIKKNWALPLYGVAIIIMIIGCLAIPNNVERLFNTFILLSFSALTEITTYTYILITLFLLIAPFAIISIVQISNHDYIDCKFGLSKEATALRIKIVKIVKLIGNIFNKLSIICFVLTAIINVSDIGLDWLWATILYNQRTSVELYIIAYVAAVIYIILVPDIERVKEMYGDDSKEYNFLKKEFKDNESAPLESDTTEINWKFIKEEVLDEDLKAKLYDIIKSENKDLNGDLILYNGKIYYADTNQNVVRIYREE